MNKRLPGYMTVAAGFVPLACKMPYMFRAWRQSPLDRFDWIFGALFLAAAGIAWSRLRERREKPDGVALAALLPDFRLREEHSLTEGMAEFVPVYKLLGKIPAIRNISNKIIVLERK